MIDFNNGALFKLKKTSNDEISNNIEQLMISGESIVSTYKAVRDYVVFTSKRVITLNVQGITGTKKDYTSLPYSKIQAYSIETSGTFDLDSELEMYFSGLGKVKFEFKGNSDIIKLGQIISEFVL